MKKTIILMVLLCLVAATLLTTVSFADGGTLSFDIIYPTENYVSMTEPTVFAASGDTLALFEADASGERGTLLLRDMTQSREDKVVQCGIAPSKMLISANTLLAVCGKKLYSLDVTAAAPTFLEIAVNSLFDSAVRTMFADVNGLLEGVAFYSGSVNFYAHSPYGVLCVYSSDLTARADRPFAMDLCFTGSPALAFCGESVFSFRFEAGVQTLYEFNHVSGERRTVRTTSNVVGATGADALFCYDVDSVYALDRTGGGVLTQISTPTAEFSAQAVGEKLYILSEGAVSEYALTDESVGDTTAYALTLKRTICKVGADKFHLNSPSAIETQSDGAIIADSGNDRIVRFKSDALGSTVTLYQNVLSPCSVAEANGVIYAASAHTLVALHGGESVRFAAQSDILSVAAADGQVFTLDADGVCYFNGNSLIRHITQSGGVALTTSEKGSLLYVLTTSGVSVFGVSGQPTNVTFPQTIGAKAIAVDYVGNIYLAFENGLIRTYARTLSEYSLTAEYTVGSSSAVAVGEITALDIQVDASGNGGSKLLFASSNSFVGAINGISPTSAADHSQIAAPTVTAQTPVHFATATQNAPFYNDYTNLATAVELDSSAQIIVFETTLSNPLFSYVLVDDAFGFVPSACLTAVAETAPENPRGQVLHASANVYAYPYLSETTPIVGTLTKDTALTVIGDAVGIANPQKWYRVSGGGFNGYMPRYDVTFVTHANPLTLDTSDYGKVKSEKLGTLVSVYAQPNTDSDVLFRLSDGKEVMLLDASRSDFVKIKYDGVVGYLRHSDFTTNSLTSAQRIGLTVGIITLLAGLTVMLIVHTLRKRERLKEDEEQ